MEDDGGAAARIGSAVDRIGGAVDRIGGAVDRTDRADAVANGAVSPPPLSAGVLPRSAAPGSRVVFFGNRWT
jgi:hypothetical protein